MKKITRFYPRVRTKNYSSSKLRDKTGEGLSLHPMRSIVRLGSKTQLSTVYPKSFNKHPIIEINSIDSIENSRSKLLMKKCFDSAEINHAKWQTGNDFKNNPELKFPVILKRIYGYKGRGMILLNTIDDLDTEKDWTQYIAEEYYTYSREYRLHCTQEGCFYTCRKMLKRDAEERWYRNDSNCVWILETNPLFDRPINFDKVENQCVLALNAVGLDIGAFDIKIQSAVNSKGKEREDPKFIIIEVNSAPSFGEITLQKYKLELDFLIEKKIENYAI